MAFVLDHEFSQFRNPLRGKELGIQTIHRSEIVEFIVM